MSTIGVVLDRNMEVTARLDALEDVTSALAAMILSMVFVVTILAWKVVRQCRT